MGLLLLDGGFRGWGSGSRLVLGGGYCCYCQWFGCLFCTVRLCVSIKFVFVTWGLCLVLCGVLLMQLLWFCDLVGWRPGCLVALLCFYSGFGMVCLRVVPGFYCAVVGCSGFGWFSWISLPVWWCVCVGVLFGFVWCEFLLPGGGFGCAGGFGWFVVLLILVLVWYCKLLVCGAFELDCLGLGLRLVWLGVVFGLLGLFVVL